MRRLLIFSTLILILASVYQLRTMVATWHYVVSAEPGDLVYAASFDLADDWEQDPGQAISSEISAGTMRIRVNESGAGLYSAADLYFHNFDYVVEAQAVEGPLDNGFGVIFRQRDRDSYYTFFISSDGYYRVSRVVNGETKVLSNWHPSEAINQGINVRNRLRVVAYNDRFRFHINDQAAPLCIPNDPDGESTPNNVTGECQGGRWSQVLVDDSIAVGRIGVTVRVDLGQPPGVVVLFDNVLVYGPEPIGELTP